MLPRRVVWRGAARSLKFGANAVSSYHCVTAPCVSRGRQTMGCSRLVPPRASTRKVRRCSQPLGSGIEAKWSAHFDREKRRDCFVAVFPYLRTAVCRPLMREASSVVLVRSGPMLGQRDRGALRIRCCWNHRAPRVAALTTGRPWNGSRQRRPSEGPLVRFEKRELALLPAQHDVLLQAQR
jgi:hypothetical protein